MNALVAWLTASFLNALWQTALVFCAAILAARWLRPLGARTAYRVWIAALLLAAILPFCRVHPALWIAQLRALFAPAGDGAVSVQMEAATLGGAAHSWLPGRAQLLLAALFLLLVGLVGARLLRSLWRARMLLAQAEPVEPAGVLAELLQKYAQRLGLDPARVRVARLAELHGPATLGLVRHTLLLPADLLVAGALTADEREELAATLAHELVHMRRRDFAWNLLFELLSLPVAWHPLLRLTRGQMEAARELAVDERAALLLAGNRVYARSLVRIAARLAARPSLRPIVAMGIYDSNIFERRIVNLMRKAEEVSWRRRVAAVAGCAVLALGASYTAMALQANVSPAGEAQAAPVVKNGVASLSAAQAEDNLIAKVTPVYPPKAKAAGVDGTVRLNAKISKTGHVENLVVLSGPAMLQKPALEAVREWVYKPYLLNGQPVEVETQIQVIYTLASKSADKHEPQASAPKSAPTEDASGATLPRLIREVEPVFPPEARARHQEGMVLVKTKIDATGRPTVLSVEGPEVFWQAARHAVAQYRFLPATRAGQPVEVKLAIEVNFHLY